MVASLHSITVRRLLSTAGGWARCIPQEPGIKINGGTVPYKAIFYGDVPLHRPYIGLIYGRYLQFRILKIPLIKMSPAVALPIVPYGAPPGIPGVRSAPRRLIATPKILDLSPLQDFLGIRSPEPPAGLRASKVAALSLLGWLKILTMTISNIYFYFFNYLNQYARCVIKLNIFFCASSGYRAPRYYDILWQ